MSFDTTALSHGALPPWPHAPRTIHAARSVGNQHSGRLERAIFVAFVVIGYTVPTISESVGTNIPQDVFWLIVAAIVSLTLIRDRTGILATIRSAGPLALLLSLAVVSAAWSDDPMTSMRRSAALVASAAASLCLVRRFGIETFVRNLGLALTILTIISIACITLLPDIGLTPDGDWQGCLTRKNGLGQVMVLGVTTLSCAMPSLHGRQRIGAFAAVVSMLILLVGAKSGTSLVVALALGVLVPLALWARRRFVERPRIVFVLACFLLAVVGIVSSIGQETALDALGKDTTLTGRTGVWQFTSEAIEERPLLGYGYKVFWLSNGAADPSGRTGTWATQAHNGLIEIGLDLGITGMLIAILFVGVAVRRSAALFWYGGDLLACWPLFVLFAFVLTNFTEATIAKYYDVSWIVVVVAFFYAPGTTSTHLGIARKTGTIA